MNINLKAKRGYTLVEILVATTIFVTVVSMGMATYNSASGFQSKSAVIRETNQALRYTVDAIVRDIRTADSSVYFRLNSVDYVSKGFVFVNDTNQPQVLNAPATIYPTIKIYRKGVEDCANYVEEITYTIDRVNNKLNQSIRFLEHKNLNDMNSPAAYSRLVVGSPTCKSSSVIESLSPRVKLTKPNIAGGASYTSYFKGVESIYNMTRSIGTEESAYVDMSLEVEPAGADGTVETSRIFRLKTTVVPRNLF